MLAQAIVAFFKYKAIGSVIVLTCWPSFGKDLVCKDPKEGYVFQVCLLENVFSDFVYKIG